MTVLRRTHPDSVACGTCLDFRHLNDLGPCPWCARDEYAEHVLAVAARQYATLAEYEREAA